MLKFVDLNKKLLLKEIHQKEKVILMKFITNLLQIKQKNNQADVLNAEFLSVKSTVHLATIYQTG